MIKWCKDEAETLSYHQMPDVSPLYSILKIFDVGSRVRNNDDLYPKTAMNSFFPGFTLSDVSQ